MYFAHNWLKVLHQSYINILQASKSKKSNITNQQQQIDAMAHNLITMTVHSNIISIHFHADLPLSLDLFCPLMIMTFLEIKKRALWSENLQTTNVTQNVLKHEG